jgi:uncharacterized membrane protein YhaH (DUF805 family)
MSTLLSNFDIRGRLSRGGFWLQTILIWIAYSLTNTLLNPIFGNIAAWFFSLVVIFALATLAIRRLHDRNLSGIWLLIILVPIAGAVWLFWQLACRKGLHDSNRWGENPLISKADFLVVQ